jgi:hypothetical protein
MWLHVRPPDGPWRRYPMTVRPEPGGVTGSLTLPANLLDPQGNAPYYVSALATTGEEYFSEIRNAAPARRAKPAPSAVEPHRGTVRITPTPPQTKPAEPARLDTELPVAPPALPPNSGNSPDSAPGPRSAPPSTGESPASTR